MVVAAKLENLLSNGVLVGIETHHSSPWPETYINSSFSYSQDSLETFQDLLVESGAVSLGVVSFHFSFPLKARGSKTAPSLLKRLLFL